RLAGPRPGAGAGARAGAGRRGAAAAGRRPGAAEGEPARRQARSDHRRRREPALRAAGRGGAARAGDRGLGARHSDVPAQAGGLDGAWGRRPARRPVSPPPGRDASSCPARRARLTMLAVAADVPKTVKRRLAAVLSADAAGYSRLMSEDEDATIAALGA